MNDDSIYHVAGNKIFTLVESEKIGREKANLQLTIQLAAEKITALKSVLDEMNDSSKEYDILQQQTHDYEMLIGDCEDRFNDLSNIPQ